MPAERHGDWPLYVPPEQRTPEWELYEQMAGPLDSCGPDCDAMCVCPGEVADDAVEA